MGILETTAINVAMGRKSVRTCTWITPGEQSVTRGEASDHTIDKSVRTCTWITPGEQSVTRGEKAIWTAYGEIIASRKDSPYRPRSPCRN